MVEDLAFHLADLVANAVRAGAKLVEIELAREGGELALAVRDDGAGMGPEAVQRAGDPFFTTKPGRRIGLGLAFLRQTAEELGGSFCVRSAPGQGTCVEARLPWAHPDRPPLGDLPGTLLPLVATSPVEFRLIFRDHRQEWRLDTQELKRTLGPVPLTDPEVLSFLEREMRAALAALGWKEEE
ncbi:MAG: ATP-binding protein [Candidatus Bipolaricaulaceae bacterium]